MVGVHKVHVGFVRGVVGAKVGMDVTIVKVFGAHIVKMITMGEVSITVDEASAMAEIVIHT